MKIAIITANIGGFDHPVTHLPQSVPYDYHLFTDKNFPLRSKAMTPRLQAKIPKCFGWQVAPGYDYYLWIDACFTLTHHDALKYFLDNCQDYDVVALRHPKRPNIREEYRYVRRGMHQSSFLSAKYENELLEEQWQAISSDRSYKDDTLLSGGVFMYRNTPQVQAALKEWWYHISRYEIMDQLAFPYVLKKAGLRINILPDSYGEDCWFMKGQGHIYRRK